MKQFHVKNQVNVLNNSTIFLQFVGYDVNNCVPHWTGEITHMFPTDGGTIRTERSEFPSGTQ